MRPSIRALAAVLLAFAAGSVGLAGPGYADPGACPNGAAGAAGYQLTLAPSLTSATVGTNHTITATLTDPQRGGPVSGFCLDFVQNTGPSVGWPRHAFTDSAGQAPVTWTSTTAGTDSITARYTDTSKQFVTATIRHTWTAKPTPTATPSTSATPKPTPSPSPSPAPKPTGPSPSSTPSTPGGTPSPGSTPPPTSGPSATPTGTPTPTAAASPTGSGSPAPAPAATGFGNGSIQLGRPSALPGGTAVVGGRDCPAGATVAYSLDGAAAGSTTARADGTFSGTVQLPGSIGQHLITVTCAGRTATVPIDLVVSSGTSTPAAGVTAAAVLVFFVLLGSVLFARGNATRTVAEPEPDPAP